MAGQGLPTSAPTRGSGGGAGHHPGGHSGAAAPSGGNAKLKPGAAHRGKSGGGLDESEEASSFRRVWSRY